MPHQSQSRFGFIRPLSLLILAMTIVLCTRIALGQSAKPKFHVVAIAEAGGIHKPFVDAAKIWLAKEALLDGFSVDYIENTDPIDDAFLSKYQLFIQLNYPPYNWTPAAVAAFQRYIEEGRGGWIGFHIAAYNDSDTHWPWFLDFLGGGVFYGNNWPPLPATLTVDDPHHPIAAHIPSTFLSPSNEWYIWKPSPRLNKDVKVLLSLSPANYPIGLKDVIKGGDVPVVWTNTRYRMLYLNMGHGDKIFTSDVQNRLFEDALRWLLAPAP